MTELILSILITYCILITAVLNEAIKEQYGYIVFLSAVTLAPCIFITVLVIKDM